MKTQMEFNSNQTSQTNLQDDKKYLVFKHLTLIWVSFLGAYFEVGVGEGVKLPPPPSKTP